ncbi:lactate/malate family dehydrogenase [Metamycoplasma hyosynoviae]|uniref:lactate/malate family dehydrogenase n=1 Tax=Metamycoplasma hyosynoviae TaxID=29559 RepID=UPI002358714C|nr:lactate dehydrogenase [Metamycoplasma hyosynoviae]MDC8900587.1 lactate dehydrogenase [Metamycoplasma hyosynoviae]MDC8914682.1 lactate dehydrogenase [Metamycoplasma hyosynoviae]MDC8917560.1 lactate dehydrogenase [Metamycoplasma hyosynoviae]MDD1371489.1 lactate dehydrogenase [Metamycoplasma hyosynoviae]MDD7848016.1 lactate dehydrogenase [Metamycoplasma hyosynoviae]
MKIGIVGVGAVGSSYLYAALNKGVEANYILIDAFEKFAEAQAKDLNDAACSMANCGSTFEAGKYSDLSDAQIVVITASVKPKEGKLQDRLELLKDNALLIKEIAENIKKSGFKGITIIASNPVDIMASVYQQVTKFEPNKVISSGTILETARMKKFLSQKLKVKASSITGFVIGEHGARCIIPFLKMRIGLGSLKDWLANGTVTKEWLDDLGKKVKDEAFEIISGKGITNFGIGENLAEITLAIENDRQSVYSLGVQLSKEYKNHGIYFGLPVILGKDGYRHLPKIRLEEDEQKLFDDYSREIKETVIEILNNLKIKHNL